MKKIIIIALLLSVGLLAGCSHKVVMDDGSVQNVGSRESMEMYYQAKTQSEVKVAKFNAIADATTERQAILLAFEMGKGDGVQFQLRKTWDERAFPWVRMLMMSGWGPVADLGNNKHSGPVVKGDKNFVYMINADSRRDTVVGLNDNDSVTQTSHRETDVRSNYEKMDNDVYNVGE